MDSVRNSTSSRSRDDLLDAIFAGTKAATLGDMPEENIVKSLGRGAVDAVTLPMDVYQGKVDPTSDEGIIRSLNAAGMGATGGIGRAAVRAPTPEVELGIFAGPRARTAPNDKYFRAERISAKGATPEDVWYDTGHMQLPNSDWVHEISDHLMKLRDNPSNSPRLFGTEKWPGAVSHPDLVNAYPDIANTTISREGDVGGYSVRPGGEYKGVTYRHGKVAIPKQKPAIPQSFGWDVVDPMPTMYTDPSSVLAHELQHQVAAREGLPKGSSPEFVSALLDWKMKYQPDVDDLTRAIYDSFKSMPEEAQIGITHRLYQRDLGEMMARATQYRQHLTPEQRIERPPWLDFDLGMDRAIIPRY